MKLQSLFKQKARGFTLVELMISLAIMMIMTGLLLSNYPESAVRMTLINSVQSTALLIREAQVRGSAVDSANSSVGGYGVYIKIADQSKVILFADSVNGFNSSGLPIGDGLYQTPPNGLIDETNSTTSLPPTYNITKFCVGQSPDTVCSTAPNSSLTISFTRPSPQPDIYMNDSKTVNYSRACIEFHSPRAGGSIGHIRSVEVYNSGMIRTAISACN